VTPAPTSVTVFVGYTNPFWLLSDGTAPPFGDAVEIFSFADYEAQFGGFFSSPYLPDYVGRALFQFFQNGGSTAYVVSIEPGDYTPGGAVTAATVSVDDGGGDGYTFTAKQPVGVSTQDPPGQKMTVTFSNLTKTTADDDTADLTIVYGAHTVETYRRVLATDLAATVTRASQLVSVAEDGNPAAYTGLDGASHDLIYAVAPAQGATVIDLTAFADVFATNAPLDKVPIFNLMLLPGISDPSVLAQALAYSEQKRAFYIMDAPENAVADSLAAHLSGVPAGATPMADIIDGGTPPPTSINGAIYFPYLRVTDQATGNASTSPPSGFVAGIFAREDVNRGVWKSPAGLETTVLGTTGVVPWGVLTDQQHGVLNMPPNFVNCLRSFPGIGTVVFGARTLVAANVAQEQWRYVAVRRMALFLEQSLYSALKWAIFEPNDVPLWTALKQEVDAFMLGLFRQGAFQGTTTDQAFRVQCDSTTTSQADIDNGIVNIIVSFAPLKPAEFVVVKIAQLAGQSET